MPEQPNLFEEVLRKRGEREPEEVPGGGPEEPNLFEEILKTRGTAPKVPGEIDATTSSINKSTNLQTTPREKNPADRVGTEFVQSFQGEPLPQDFREAARMAQANGLALRGYEELSEDIELKAGLMAHETLQRLSKKHGGLIIPKHVEDLTAAFRYIATVGHVPISDEQIPRVSSRFIKILTRKGQDIILSKLNEAANYPLEGRAVASKEYITRLQGWAAQLKGWESRADSVEVQRRFLSMGMRTIPKVLTPPTNEGKRALRVATNTIGWARMQLPPPAQALPNNKVHIPDDLAIGIPGLLNIPVGASTRYGQGAEPDQIFQEIFRDVNTPRAPANFVKEAWSLAQEEAMVELLGVPDVVTDLEGNKVPRSAISLDGVIGYTHPELMIRILADMKSRKIGLGDGRYSRAAEKRLRRSVLTQSANALYDLMLDRRLEAAEERLKFFDPVALDLGKKAGFDHRIVSSFLNEAVVPAFMKALEGVTEVFDVGTYQYSKLREKVLEGQLGTQAQLTGLALTEGLPNLLAGVRKVPGRTIEEKVKHLLPGEAPRPEGVGQIAASTAISRNKVLGLFGKAADISGIVPLLNLTHVFDSSLTIRDDDKDLKQTRQDLAQGVLDPVVTLRASAAHHKTGLLTNLGVWNAVDLAGPEVAGQLQPLAAADPKIITAPLLQDLLKQAQAKALNDVLTKNWAFISEEEMKAADAETAKLLRGMSTHKFHSKLHKHLFNAAGGSGLELVLSIMRGAAFRISNETRAAIEMTVSDPNTIPLNVAAAYAFKPAAAVARKSIMAPVRETTVRAIQASRARRALADVAAYDMDHAEALREALSKVAFKDKTPAAQEAHMRAAEVMARTVADEHKLHVSQAAGQTTRAARRKTMPRHVRRIRNILQQVAPENLLEIVDEMGLAQGIVEMIKRDSVADVLKVITEEVGERLGMNKRRLFPSIVENSANLAKMVDELIEAAPSPAGTVSVQEAAQLLKPAREGAGFFGLDRPVTLPGRDVARRLAIDEIKFAGEALPFSLDGLTGGASRLRDWVDGKISVPLWDAVIGNKNAVRKGEAYRALADYVINSLALMKDWRIMQGVQRSHQIKILKYLNEKARSQAADFQAEFTLARNQGAEIPLDRADRYRELMQLQERTLTDIDTLDGHPWDQPVKLSNIEGYVKELDLHDWDALLTDLEPQGDLAAAFRQLQDLPDFNMPFEEFESLWKMWLQAPKPELIPQISKIKKQLVQLYGDSQGLGVVESKTGKQVFDRDLESGELFLPVRAREVRRARKGELSRAKKKVSKLRGLSPTRDVTRQLKQAQAELAAVKKRRGERPELYDPATNYGFARMPAGEELKSIRKWGDLFETSKGQGILQRFNEMDSGSLKDGIQRIKATEMDTRMSLYAMSQLSKRQRRAYERLTPKQKDNFNEAVRLWGEGDNRSLTELAAKHPKLFFGNHDPDTNVLHLLEESESFRNMLVSLMDDVGMLEKGAYDDYAGPYAPHVYSAYESPRLMKRFNKDVEAEKFFGDGSEAMGSGLDLSELLSQRDITRYRVLVRRPGQRQVSRLFETKDEAAEWLKNSHGIRDEAALQKGGTGGKTKLGFDFKILDPVGLEHADRNLGLLPRGAGLMRRFETMIRDIHLWKYLRSFDRPGWVIDGPEFEARLKANPKEGKQWVQLPNTRAFGPLRGKRVARPLATLAQQFISSYDDMGMVLESLRKTIAPVNIAANVFGHFLGAVGGFNKLTRQVLTKNAISRDPLTLATNYLMDMQIFGRMAFGDDFLYHPDGHEARKLAFKILFNSESGMRGVLAKGLKNPNKFFKEIQRQIGDDFDELNLTPDEKILANELFHGVIGDQLVGKVVDDDFAEDMLRIIYGKPDADLPSRGPVNNKKSNYRVLKDALMIDDHHEALNGMRARIRQIQEQMGADDINRMRGRPTIDRDTRLLMEQEKQRLILTIEDIHRQDVLQLTGESFLNFLGRGIGATEKRGLSGATKSFSRELYARTGNMGRVSGYIFLRRRGWSADAALKEVNKFMQDYSGVPPFINKLSRNPFGAAITSFPYEMMRITKNWITERPFQFAAMPAIISSYNLINMAAGGIDPFDIYAYMEQNSGGMPASMAMAFTPIVPAGPKGTFATVQMPGVHPMLMFRSPYGMLSGVIEREDLPEGIIGDVAQSTLNIGLKYFFSQPAMSTVVNSIRGVDSLSGRPFESKSAAVLENIKDFAGLFMPSWVPFAGRNYRDFYQLASRPPRARTGEAVSKLEALAQVGFGVRTRGGVFDRAVDNLGIRDQVDTVVNIMAQAATGGISNPFPEYGFISQALGKEAFIAGMAWKGRALDLSGGYDFDVPIDRALDEMRGGLTHMRTGVKAKDNKQVEVGRRMRDRGLATLKERMTTTDRLYGVDHTFTSKRSKITQEKLPPKESVTAIVNMLHKYDFQMLSKAGPIVQTYVLTRFAARPTSTEKEIRDLYNLMTRTPSGAVAGGGDTRRLEDAEAIMKSYLSTRTSDRGLQYLNNFQIHLHNRKISAYNKEYQQFYNHLNRTEGFRDVAEDLLK